MPGVPVWARVGPTLHSGYSASVREIGQPDLSRSDFRTMEEAKEWAERYFVVFVENAQLRQQVELQKGWLNYQYTTIKELQKHIGATELLKLRHHIDDSVGQDTMPSQEQNADEGGSLTGVLSRFSLVEQKAVFAALLVMVKDIHSFQDNLTEQEWQEAENICNTLEFMLNTFSTS